MVHDASINWNQAMDDPTVSSNFFIVEKGLANDLAVKNTKVVDRLVQYSKAVHNATICRAPPMEDS